MPEPPRSSNGYRDYGVGSPARRARSPSSWSSRRCWPSQPSAEEWSPRHRCGCAWCGGRYGLVSTSTPSPTARTCGY
nr:hypothetical protein [Pseudonocardia sp. N23]